ncbi:hypothetical protein PPTG_20885 [Phytophthora nicotianae INRA-310]|uniref:Uncharacterized protein n=1 Tax=Phytophthora nicotianae (strain INRA-310) TaxID=761204 RepID=W2RBN7_PHYN3|nr:hypothetical protein PPTG_20885 [Phytophthora nicotianae INRA-310]ETN22114.1 hypothetical protein PPTG_20885 [Phytophthora nicotianae INRA-310]
MVQTSFQDWDDKQLVQIAQLFESQGIRVTWDYVARRMKKTRRSAKELRLPVPRYGQLCYPDLLLDDHLVLLLNRP